MRVNDAIKCDKCGYRILYKKRRTDDNEPIQYEAVWNDRGFIMDSNISV